MSDNLKKDIYVRVSGRSPKRNTIEYDFTRLHEEHEKESGELKNWNLFSGGGIGASLGLFICLVTSLVGVPIASPDILAIVGGSLLLGVVAGYVLF